MATGWRRLGALIRAEAAGRYRTHAQFAAAAGVSVRTIEELVRGQRTRYSPVTVVGVESALGWEPGSVVRVLEGGQPVRVPDPGLARIRDAWPYLSVEQRRILLAVLAAIRA